MAALFTYTSLSRVRLTGLTARDFFGLVAEWARPRCGQIFDNSTSTAAAGSSPAGYFLRILLGAAVIFPFFLAHSNSRDWKLAMTCVRRKRSAVQVCTVDRIECVSGRLTPLSISPRRPDGGACPVQPHCFRAARPRLSGQPGTVVAHAAWNPAAHPAAVGCPLPLASSVSACDAPSAETG